MISGPGLTNNLKRTTAATAITIGMIHLAQGEPLSSREPLLSRGPSVLPLGLTGAGRG